MESYEIHGSSEHSCPFKITGQGSIVENSKNDNISPMNSSPKENFQNSFLDQKFDEGRQNSSSKGFFNQVSERKSSKEDKTNNLQPNAIKSSYLFKESNRKEKNEKEDSLKFFYDQINSAEFLNKKYQSGSISQNFDDNSFSENNEGFQEFYGFNEKKYSYLENLETKRSSIKVAYFRDWYLIKFNRKEKSIMSNLKNFVVHDDYKNFFFILH